MKKRRIRYSELGAKPPTEETKRVSTPVELARALTPRSAAVIPSEVEREPASAGSAFESGGRSRFLDSALRASLGMTAALLGVRARASSTGVETRFVSSVGGLAPSSL